MDEQRKFERQDYRDPVQYRITPGQEPRGCVAYDFSGGGARFRASEFIPLNAEIYLDIRFPEIHIQQLPVRVAWVQRVPNSEMYEIGVEFKNSSSANAI